MAIRATGPTEQAAAPALDFRHRRADKRRPMSVSIKICGITRAEAADASVRAGADFAGLVFHPKSPRALEPDAAAGLADRMRGRLRLVALFADADDALIARVVDRVRPDVLQLHGAETPARTAAIRDRFGRSVIKAIAVAGPEDFVGLGAYEDVADMLLFDAKAPAGSRPGGLGVAFDWQILRGRRFSRPVMLAGGLNPDNVGRALAVTDVAAVDVSSGVESAPGVKSPDLIRAFVSAVRSGAMAAESFP